MVSGVSSNTGTSGLFSRSFLNGSGTFNVSEENPRNLLQIDPTFKKPSTELRVAERRRAEDNPFRDQNRNNKNPLADQVRAETFLGEQSVRQLETEQSDPINLGGSPLNVRDGAVTFQSGENSIEISEEDEARVLENDDGSLTVVNKSTDERATFSQGDEISVSGEGTAEITGTRRRVIEGGGETVEKVASETISASDGATLTVSESGRGDTTLRKPDSAESIQLGQQKTAIDVQGNSGEVFSFSNDQGRSITFTAGESGSIVTNDDGSVTITNETTGQSERFSTDQDLSTGGSASANLENEAGAELTFEGSQDGQFATNEDGAIKLSNTDTVETTAVSPRREPPQGERPVRVRTFSDPQTSTASLIQEELISRPDREAREQRRVEQEEQNEQALRGENNEEESEEPPTTSEAEEESLLAASFREDTEDNPFAVDESSGEENPFAVDEEDDEGETNPFAPDQESEESERLNRNRRTAFSTNGSGNESPFSVTNETSQSSRNQLSQTFSGDTNGFSSGGELNFIA